MSRRLMLLGDEITDVAKINCYTDVWAHFLPAALRRRGIELVFGPFFANTERSITQIYRALPLDDVDHVLALGLRYFTLHPISAFAALQARCDGVVAQLYDGPIDTQVWTLTCRDATVKRTYQIGWAADSDMCLPKQSPNELRILIDHPHYEGSDYSRQVWGQVADFARSDLAKRFGRVHVRVTVDGGFEDWDCGQIAVKRFHRGHIPYPDACAEYSKTDIFLPTHAESLGLVVLETAMAGALTVARSGFIYPDRLNSVRHVTYSANQKIPWERVIDELDVGRSRAVAMSHSWDAVAERVETFFYEGGWKR